MKTLNTMTVIAGLMAGPAISGGIEAFPTQNHFLFEDGRYAEFTYVYIDPKNSGTEAGQSTGNVTPSVSGASLAYKQDLGSDWVLAARAFKSLDYRINYPTGTSAPSAGTHVDYRGYAVDFLARYKFNQNFSAYGGVRLEKVTRFEGELVNSGFPIYGLDADGDVEPGFILGAAYEIPDINFRADLTYTSEIKHTLSGTQTTPLTGSASVSTPFVSPESVKFNVQSGVSKNLFALFGVNWRNWKDATVNPPGAGGPILEFTEDSVDVQLGLGYLYNPNWYFYGILSSSNPEGGIAGFDYDNGGRGITLGTIFTQGNTRVIFDYTYARFGDVDNGATGLQIDGARTNALRLSIAQNF
ncbi:hypothetical protein [Ruegeria sp. Ofav3-42]|uniref:hypothetical protein n=1 Tax=Ruegeria sp. Ofav3-42 TaxID=2917759 RepID=UPI001EF6BBC8|nr:hypothetical protein [Ruegeria sp. Ofav3-42]MCG7522051.1 hypothetical protein [Ruegeria sp. Ofav3-42]